MLDLASDLRSSLIFWDPTFFFFVCQKTNTLGYWLTEHLRVDSVNWSLNTLHLLGHPDAMDKEKIVEYLVRCQHHNGTIDHL